MQIGNCRECQIDLSSAPSATAGDQTLCAACDWAFKTDPQQGAVKKTSGLSDWLSAADDADRVHSLKERFLTQVSAWEYSAKCSIASQASLDKFERFDPELIAARRKVHEAVQAAADIITKRREGR